MKASLVNETRLFVHDPLHQWTDEGESFATREEFYARIANWSSRIERDAARERGKPRTLEVGRLVLHASDEGSAEWLCKVAETLGDCSLALDECDWSFSPSTVPKEVKDLISYSRHSRVDIHAGARRPASVPRLLTSQADEIVVYRLTEPRDLDYLASYCGVEFAERAGRLKRHESMTWAIGYEAPNSGT